jgi:ABC-type transporter Mla MlaB component
MDLILEVCTGRQRATMACHGKLIGGDEANAFRRSALLLMGGFDRITIDLEGIRSADADGMGALASVLAYAVEKGKQARLTRASVWLLPMLQSCGIVHFLVPYTAPVPRLACAQEACA